MGYLNEEGTKKLYQLLVKKINNVSGGLSDDQADQLSTLWNDKVGNSASLRFTGGGNGIKGDSLTVSLSWEYTELGKKVTPDSLKLTKGSEVLQQDPTFTSYSSNDPVTTNTTYTLTVQHGKITKTANTSYTFYTPVFAGCATVSTTKDLQIAQLTGANSTSSKLAAKNDGKSYATSVQGTYTGTASEGQYFWICVPQGTSVASITSGGFDVPFSTQGSKIENFNGTNAVFDCYRVSNPLAAGSFSFDINKK